jgi:hypothetical protein
MNLKKIKLFLRMEEEVTLQSWPGLSQSGLVNFELKFSGFLRSLISCFSLLFAHTSETLFKCPARTEE